MALKRQQFYDNFITNLERERVALGLTQSQMAKKLQMSTSGYKKMIAGETSKIDLHIAYLMFLETGKLLCELCGESTPELDLAKKIRHLTTSQRNFINGIVDFEIDFTDRTPNVDDYVPVFTPTGNFDDGMFWDSTDLDSVNVAAYRQKFGDDLHCGVRVTSNHLHPVYHSGDILLICRKSPRDGDTGIFINRENGRAYLRKFHQTDPCLLEPVNDHGVTFAVDPNNEIDMNQWIKFGYVLAKMRQESDL